MDLKETPKTSLDLSQYPFLRQSLELYERAKSQSFVMNFPEEFLGLLGNTKMEELEKQWKVLRVEELEICMKRYSLIKEQKKLLLNACELDQSSMRPSLKESFNFLAISREDFDNKLMNLQQIEVKLFLKWLDLLSEQTTLLLDAIKSSSLSSAQP